MSTTTGRAPRPPSRPGGRCGVGWRSPGAAHRPRWHAGAGAGLHGRRVAVPVAVQRGIDGGIVGGLDLNVISLTVAITAGVLVVTTACGYLMMRRLFTVSETALAGVRTRAFRHVHDLSMLHQQSERGSLVSG
ncbi:hypothetical protein V2I01_01910 [Micromonospora sp. BRA006-A]|nr:hypothetical protein [Micromonospora sp. BRA006-A]